MRRYVVHLATVFAATFAVLIAINLAVDPYGLFGTRILPSAIADPGTRLRGHGDRVIKAIEIRNGNYNLLIAGSSRVLLSLNPASPSLTSYRAYNAGVGAATLPEVAKVVSFVVEQAPSTKRVIWGLDFDLFFHPRLQEADFAYSGFAGKDISSGYLRYLFSIDAMQGVFRAISRLSKGQRLEMTDTGFMRGRGLQRTASQQRLEFGYLTDSTLELIDEARSIVSAGAMARMAILEGALREASRSGIDVDLILPPAHIYRLQAFDMPFAEPFYDVWKRRLTALAARAPGPGQVRVWDFGYANPITTEPLPQDGGPLMRWHYEASHFSEAAGDLVLARLVGKPLTGSLEGLDFGYVLTPDTIDERLATDRERRRLWAEQNRAFMADLEASWQAVSTGAGKIAIDPAILTARP